MALRLPNAAAAFERSSRNASRAACNSAQQSQKNAWLSPISSGRKSLAPPEKSADRCSEGSEKGPAKALTTDESLQLGASLQNRFATAAIL